MVPCKLNLYVDYKPRCQKMQPQCAVVVFAVHTYPRQTKGVHSFLMTTAGAD